eukprot:scaffold203450_cov21-Tisochrysis_lutea.AAC.1
MGSSGPTPSSAVAAECASVRVMLHLASCTTHHEGNSQQRHCCWVRKCVGHASSCIMHHPPCRDRSQPEAQQIHSQQCHCCQVGKSCPMVTHPVRVQRRPACPRGTGSSCARVPGCAWHGPG